MGVCVWDVGVSVKVSVGRAECVCVWDVGRYVCGRVFVWV